MNRARRSAPPARNDALVSRTERVTRASSVDRIFVFKGSKGGARGAAPATKPVAQVRGPEPTPAREAPERTPEERAAARAPRRMAESRVPVAQRWKRGPKVARPERWTPGRQKQRPEAVQGSTPVQAGPAARQL